MTSILDEIVAHKRFEIEAARRRRSESELKIQLADAPPVRRFTAAVGSAASIALIAEVKKASPSAGLIRDDFDAVSIAREYQTHGATCVSVLTDERFFQGSLEDLRRIRSAVDIPVLRKDFILDPYQVLEARVAGADCVLLIAECLTDGELQALHRCILDFGMDALVEFYEPASLHRVLTISPALVGINNRNLKTFTTDLEHTIRLRHRIPAGVLLIGESGIRTRSDVERLESAGVDAVLVGESLMRQPDVGRAVHQLLGTD